MGSFLTPYQMFEAYSEELERKHFNLQKKMFEYATRAEDKIGEHVACIAEAYMNGIEKAYDIFSEAGLRMIHAYAVLDDEEKFDEEINEEKNKREESYWDDYEDLEGDLEDKFDYLMGLKE